MTSPTTAPAVDLRALADEFWDGFLESEPTFATIMGDRRFDDRLEDPSPDGVARDVARLRTIAERVGAIDPEALATSERVTRQMLVDEVAGQLARLETGLHEWTVDPLAGPAVRLLDLTEYQVIETPADGERMIARWRAMGPYLDAMTANLRHALATGRMAVRAPVERTLDELRALEATPIERWRLVEPAAADRPGWTDPQRTTFREDLTAAVRDIVAPAFARYREAIETEVLPATRDDDHPGVCHLPGGEAIYRSMIRVETTLDLEPAAVHELGRSEIERIDAEFVELGRRVLGTKDLATTLARLRDDPALRFATAEEVKAAAERSLERAQAATWRWFGRLPRALCEVVRIPEESEAHQTLAYYAWPALDGSRPGRFYINLHAPETRPRYEAEALAFHEAVPGHHLQLAIAQELDGLPAFQRVLGSTAFAEGWGLYTERLSDEMGLYSSDLDRFGILSFDAWRACRLVVDSGMHALAWTRTQAIDFMRAHTALGDNNIANEVDRYITWPGQALAYKVGQLEILRLRRSAEAALGERFDIRRFHDAVLGSGAVSLGTLAGIVESWIRDQAAA